MAKNNRPKKRPTKKLFTLTFDKFNLAWGNEGFFGGSWSNGKADPVLGPNPFSVTETPLLSIKSCACLAELIHRAKKGDLNATHSLARSLWEGVYELELMAMKNPEAFRKVASRWGAFPFLYNSHPQRLRDAKKIGELLGVGNRKSQRTLDR